MEGLVSSFYGALAFCTANCPFASLRTEWKLQYLAWLFLWTRNYGNLISNLLYLIHPVNACVAAIAPYLTSNTFCDKSNSSNLVVFYRQKTMLTVWLFYPVNVGSWSWLHLLHISHIKRWLWYLVNKRIGMWVWSARHFVTMQKQTALLHTSSSSIFFNFMTLILNLHCKKYKT